MKLREFIEFYLASRDVSDGYANQLRWLANSIQRTIGEQPGVEQFTPELLNQHLKATRDRLRPETRKSHRRMLLTLWQAAADAGLAPEPVRRKVMPIRVPDKLQHAWTAEQVRLLLVGADRLRGYYPIGVRKTLYWRSYVLTAWDSGLRGCDMRRISRDAIGDDGRCVLVQHKTGRLHRFRLRQETVAEVRAMFPPDRELVWPLWGRLELWRRQARLLVQLAGLRGSIGQLRHSSGTAVEVKYPGRGHEHLGNTRAVFERHYLDHEKIGFEAVLPESLL
jgi:hypothetical protein